MTAAPKTEKKKRPPAPPWKKGDVIHRAGDIFAKITGSGNYSGSLHTEQWLIPADYHDKSHGAFIPSSGDKKIDPKTTIVVFDAARSRDAIPFPLIKYVIDHAFGMGIDIMTRKDERDSEEADPQGIAEVILADKMGLDSIMLDADYRLQGSPDEAAVMTVEELFS